MGLINLGHSNGTTADSARMWKLFSTIAVFPTLHLLLYYCNQYTAQVSSYIPSILRIKSRKESNSYIREVSVTDSMMALGFGG